jgi:hypothetical protein
MLSSISPEKPALSIMFSFDFRMFRVRFCDEIRPGFDTLPKSAKPQFLKGKPAFFGSGSLLHFPVPPARQG